MKMSFVKIMHSDIGKVLELHLVVLKMLLSGDPFDEISEELQIEMKEINYLEIAANGLLSFDKQGSLIGAYPVSPIPTNYLVDIENIGSGYSMCAIDSLGIAYTFNQKTRIRSTDHSTGENIEVTIDPTSEIEKRELYVTYIASDDVNCDPAVDQCPSLNFYTSLDHIENREKYTILPFHKAVEHAIEVFGEKGMRKCIEGAMIGAQNFSLADVLIDVFEK